jgi:hypothetical protein
VNAIMKLDIGSEKCGEFLCLAEHLLALQGPYFLVFGRYVGR